VGKSFLRASQLPHDSEIGKIRLKMGEGITGWVALHKSVVALASNAAADSRFKAFQALPEDTYEAFLSVPLITGGDVTGVINVHHREKHAHTPDEVALLTFVGEQMVERSRNRGLPSTRRAPLNAWKHWLRWRGRSRPKVTSTGFYNRSPRWLATRSIRRSSPSCWWMKIVASW